MLTALAVGEMVADKTPQIPPRTDLAPLLGRVLSGALVGVLLSRKTRQSRILLALTSGVAAAASTFLFYNIRRTVGSRFGVPDFLLGFLEDVLVVALGARLGQLIRRGL